MGVKDYQHLGSGLVTKVFTATLLRLLCCLSHIVGNYNDNGDGREVPRGRTRCRETTRLRPVTA